MRTMDGWALAAALPVMLLAGGGASGEEGAAAGGSLSVTMGIMALRVEDREPVGEATSFGADVGQLTCFTRIEGAGAETVVYHVWMHGDELRAKVQLPVRSSSWRTWSSKRILPEWTGDWTVRVEDSEGRVIETVAFSVGGADD